MSAPDVLLRCCWPGRAHRIGFVGLYVSVCYRSRHDEDYDFSVRWLIALRRGGGVAPAPGQLSIIRVVFVGGGIRIDLTRSNYCRYTPYRLSVL